MNRKMILVAAIAFALGAVVAGIAFQSARGGASSGDPSSPPATAPAAKLYHCPMHPTYTSDRPGDCPICGMRLVPIEPDAHPAGGDESAPAAAAGPAVAGRAPVKIPPEKLQLIGVRTAPVERRPLVRSIRAVGRVTYDETRLHHVHTKVGGWIEKLHANSTGALVRRGEPLLTIYSPELLASQEEYLLALRARDRLSGAGSTSIGQTGEELVASARRRLRLFDITDAQIDELERTGNAARTTTLHAPITGHIVARNVSQGEKIDTETTLLDIADLSHVWVMADIYEYELPFVSAGQPATLELSYLPGRSFTGRVGFVYPILSEATRTVKARVEFANPDLALKPEMFGEVRIASDLGTKVVVPDSAVIGTGEREIAFVDRGGGRFEPRELKLGVRLPDSVEVLEGLSEGERVVVSGNFLIDSESRLKAALGAAGTTTPAAGTTRPAAGATKPDHVH